MPRRVSICVENLVKRYGTRTALAGVSLAVAPGEIVGLLGPNGAGKSTTLGILATIISFDAGRVQVAGHELPREAAAARRLLGLVPQQLALYPTLTARENLRFFARSSGLTTRPAADAVGHALALLGLEARADEPVVRLSIGMRRRLNLACGILHRPAVVLLDEPMVGIDPHSRERAFEVTSSLARDGAAVLFSTHEMHEAERLCSRVVLLDGGRVIAAGTCAAIVAGCGMTPRLALRTSRSLPAGWLGGTEGAALLADGGLTLVAVRDPMVVPAVLAAAARAGGEVLELTLHRPNLADAFFALTGRALRDDEHSADP